jgi:hypothetical protein
MNAAFDYIEAMNILDPLLPSAREAKLRYLPAEFQVIREGEYVRCAITGEAIRIDDLRYWNVDRQVAFRNASVAFSELLKGLKSPGRADP